MQQAMFDTLHAQFLSRLGVRRDYEQASGGVFNWNTSVDYAKVFNDMVRPEVKAVVEGFYRRAGLDVRADLQRVNNAPRISANPAAVTDVQRRGGHSGNPTRPLLINEVIGDATAQAVTMQAYVDKASRTERDISSGSSSVMSRVIATSRRPATLQLSRLWMSACERGSGPTPRQPP